MSKKEMCVKKNETKKLNQFNKEVVVEIWNTMAVCVIRLVGSNTLKNSVDNCLYKLQCQETLRSHFLLNRPHFVFFSRHPKIEKCELDSYNSGWREMLTVCGVKN